MKKIYLTFDIETIVSKLSYNPNFYTNVMLGAIYIADELFKRNLKATFFISMSPKTNDLDSNEYQENTRNLIKLLSCYSNIKLQPHIHMKNLPLGFDTQNDGFAFYTLEEQIKALKWAKSFFEALQINVDSFRPGSYSANTQYYEALSKAGYKFSSIMKKDNIHIDTIRNNVEVETPYMAEFGLMEYPVTSLLFHSIKNKDEVINLSPDFFTYKSIEKYIDGLNYLNINYHSFSIFTNRFARENHKNILMNNLKYIIFEKPLIKFLRLFDYEIINRNTIFRHAFIDWMNGIEKYSENTYWIGE